MTDREKTVLIVEDDAALAELEKRVLSRSGWPILIVNRCKLALEILRERSFDVVVLDYVLPDGEPWPIVEAARAKVPPIPVILVTGMGSEGIAAQALHWGVSEYVKKEDNFWETLPETVSRVAKSAAAQDSLRLSDALLQSIASNLSDVIIVADFQRRINYVSAACQHVLGYDPQEFRAILGLELVHPDDVAHVKEVLDNLRNRGRDSLVFRFRSQSDGYRWIESNVNVVADPAKGPPEIVVISRDITEHKEVEARAEKANRAKSDFLATMSHEIRTPLNAILAMSDAIWQAEKDPNLKQYAEVLRRNINGLLSLINDILDFSKIESGQLTLERVPFELSRQVAESAELAGMSACQKDLEFLMQLAPELPQAVIGDPARLRQVLVNLLGNAVKFTRRGEITLDAGLADPADPTVLQFAVTDTGIGIREEKLDSIFDEFTQADSSITRKFGGTGLGLSICRRLVELMGGRIWVTSTPNVGSTFRFTIRIEPTDMESLVDDSVLAFEIPLEDEDTLKILVAEDKADNRLALSLYLKAYPYSLTFVEDGQAAVDRFTEEPFDLVLMDLRMPVMDGIAATQVIREIEKQRQSQPIPIIAISADAGSDDAERCRLAGCTDHVSKPISLSRLLAAIRSRKRPKTAPEVPDDDAYAASLVLELRELVPNYLSDRRDDAAEIARFAERSDFKQVRELAHQIKGSGTTYGFPDLTRLAIALESAATLHDSAAVKSHSRDLLNFIEAALSPA